MENICFKDVIEIVSSWILSQKRACKVYNIEFDHIISEVDDQFVILGPSGDYIAQIISNEPYFAPYRFVMFEIVKVSTEELVYHWNDKDVPIHEIKKNLDKSFALFLKFVEESR